MILDVCEYTNKGGRDYNEDNVGSLFEGDRGIFAVCDGLGGHLKGELASESAVNVILSGWRGFGSDPAEQMKELISAANSELLAVQKQQNAMLKSTAAVLAVEEDKAVWCNTGDSRVYYFHNSELCAYTEDHSVAYKKYKAGEITRDMLGTDEDQSRLLRALGSPDRFMPDVYTAPNLLTRGDAFLLCSDGAWEYLRDEEILIDLLKATDSQKWLELLLMRIIERADGENDNLSLIAVRLV